ncbi:MAG: hypothetical protein FJW14_12870 [Acidimicrobiia bacterium]|nr:hypothetical protein [Acidimicrobiia bacterium]
MFTPAIVTIPALILPLMGTPDRDCQLGRVGDPDADARAVIAFEIAVDEYAATHRWGAHPWPLPRPGSLFTPAVSEVFRVRIAAAIREGRNEEEGGILYALPPLPVELDYRIVGRDIAIVDVDMHLVVDTLDRALPLEAAPLVPAPVETDEEETLAPADEEPTGCLYDIEQMI